MTALSTVRDHNLHPITVLVVGRESLRGLITGLAWPRLLGWKSTEIMAESAERLTDLGRNFLTES